MLKVGQKKAGDVVNVNQPKFTKMYIQVGLVIKVWNHSIVDKLL